MTTAVPADKPLISPDPLIDATGELAMLQVPPGKLLERLIVPPGHKGVFPAIGPGTEFTVIIAVDDPHALV